MDSNASNSKKESKRLYEKLLAAVNVVISGLRVIHDFGSVRHASELTDLLNTHASGD